MNSVSANPPGVLPGYPDSISISSVVTSHPDDARNSSSIRGIFLSDNPVRFETVWPSRQRERLAGLLDLHPHVINSADLESQKMLLADVEVIFSTWGMPSLSDEQLSLFPSLRAVFYAAGSVKDFAQPLLDRDITVVNAVSANAVPVAEYTLSQILFSLKLGWTHVRQFTECANSKGWNRLLTPGAYGSTIGIISLGTIGQALCELLRPFALEKLAYDPFATDEVFRSLGLTRVETLQEIFSRSDVVTLHSPWLRETEGMITGELLSAMKPNATFINTARGALVNEDELAAVLQARPDLTAVLDVTYPEPPAEASPLYSLRNVVMTPHIAGSLGREVMRMSDVMIDEFIAWKEGRPLKHAVNPLAFARMA